MTIDIGALSQVRKNLHHSFWSYSFFQPCIRKSVSKIAQLDFPSSILWPVPIDLLDAANSIVDPN